LKVFSVTIIFFVVTVFVVLSVILTPTGNVGFAVSPLFPGFALPLSYVVNSFLVFPDLSTVVSRVFDVSDSVIYRYGYVSYDGQPWQQFTLTTSNSVSGDWIYTKGTATVPFTPSQLRMSSSRNVSNNTYVVIYSCSKTTSNAWDCHDGWQITKFDAKITVSTSPALFCGDSVCNNGETCSSCQADCGTCASSLNTFYIDPNGVDSSSRNGSSNAPWKTLAYACSHVTTSGSVIHVNAGTYTETQQCQLAVGVNIEGEGAANSIIKSRVGGSDWTIQLLSGTQGTNGNQHISGIKMDGNNLAAYAPIGIFSRSNVEIYNCIFINFASRGINFQARQDPGEPTAWAIGNKFHDNTVTNCDSDTPPGSGDGTTGELMIAGQQSMLIYNNMFDATERAADSTGFIIKGVGGYNKDIKIYNNTLLKTTFDGTVWDFAMEFWNCLGGIEIYNNTMTGSIDFSGTYGTMKGSYSYGAWIHNNLIGEATVSSQTTRWTRGVQFEQQAEGIIIEKNWFKNMGSAIYFPVYHESPFTFSTYTDINIRYNIFDNLGSAMSGASGVYFNNGHQGYPNVCNGFYVYNNVFIGNAGSATGWGIEIPDVETTSNVLIRNNIVENFDSEPVYGYYAVSGLSIQNNIFYGNGNSNAPAYTGSATVQNNYPGVNPSFMSSTNFHLSPGSPAIDAGISTSWISDYDSYPVPYGKAPDIGAYEYHP